MYSLSEKTLLNIQIACVRPGMLNHVDDRKSINNRNIIKKPPHYNLLVHSLADDDAAAQCWSVV